MAEKIIKEKAPDIPIIVCVNKIDLTTHEHLKEVTELLRNSYGFYVKEISSKTGDKLDALLEAVHDAITKSRLSTLPRRNRIGKP